MPQPIDVTLYRSMEFHRDGSLPEDYGWNALLHARLRLVDVDGNHFSMLEKGVRAADRQQLTAGGAARAVGDDPDAIMTVIPGVDNGRSEID